MKKLSPSLSALSPAALTLAALALAALAVPAAAGDCDVVGTIQAIETLPDAYQLKAEADEKKSDEEAPPRYLRIDTEQASNWRSFKVGEKVEVVCQSNPEMGEIVTRITKARPKRR